MAFGAILGQRPGVQSVNNVLPDVQGNVALNAKNVGAAPAGYGLGGGGVLKDSATWNGSGFFRTSTGTPNGINIYGCQVDLWGDGQHRALYGNNASNTYGSELHRVDINGHTGEWEWVNPPTEAGVEYRTQQRWSGKVVYTKLVNCGTAINDATVTLEGMTACIRFIGYLSYPNESAPRTQLPIWSGSTIGTGYHAEITQPVPSSGVNQFIIKTDSNSDGFGAGGYNWWVHVWYTKD